MNGNLWISFVGAKAIIAVTPGPASMLVVSHGLAPGGRSRWAVLGIVLVNALYFGLAATGLGAVLSFSPDAFIAVRWIAAAVLIALGVRALWKSARVSESEECGARSGWRACWTGALLQLANPNALLFFVAILPQFVDPHKPLAPQVLMLGITGLALDVVVLTFYGAFAARLGELAGATRFGIFANRLAGCFLMLTGIFTLIR